MKVLTLWPEWAWAICHLWKRIENRSWGPPGWMIGEQLAIHAGASIGGRPGHSSTEDGLEGVGWMARRAGWTFELDELGKDWFHAEFWREEDGIERGAGPMLDTVEMPRKAIVATCVVQTGQLASEQRGWAVDGQCHWLLRDVLVLDIANKIKGKQGLWDCELM